MVATINLANTSQKLLTQPRPCAACHAPRKSFLLFFFKCWQLCKYCTKANSRSGYRQHIIPAWLPTGRNDI